jgi:DNA-binding NtrC family response regulator
MSTAASIEKEATILVVDDIVANRNLLRETLEPQGYEVLLAPSGEGGLKAARRAQPDLILLDVMMPGMDGFETCRRLKQDALVDAIPVIFITAKDETRDMVEGFRAGGVDYIAKPFRSEEVLIRIKTHLQNARLTKTVLQKNQELEAANEAFRKEMRRREQAEASLETADARLSWISEQEAERWGIEGLVGQSQTMAKILDQVRKVQPLDKTSVLLLGESGTGKELIARAIHFGGSRAKGPFLPVNCSAIPADLAESLFFGHVQGAFSGATTTKKGYFENAHDGTLFLDEIGDMPAALQAKLLRVLETGRILPLGAEREKEVEFRLIAATNADMESEIAAGKFRQDLYYRLARFVAELPPLRERKEDLPLLTRFFLDQLGTEMGIANPSMSDEALNVLQTHDYPGNIRELRNLIERALIESGGGEIRAGHLEFHCGLNTAKKPFENVPTQPAPSSRRTTSNEEERILDFVRDHGRINNTQCRELLSVGIHRAWYLLRKLHQSGRLVQDSSRRWAQYRLP